MGKGPFKMKSSPQGPMRRNFPSAFKKGDHTDDQKHHENDEWHKHDVNVDRSNPRGDINEYRRITPGAEGGIQITRREAVKKTKPTDGASEDKPE